MEVGMQVVFSTLTRRFAKRRVRVESYSYFRTGRERSISRVLDPVTDVTTIGEGDVVRITDCGGRPPVKNSVMRREIPCPPLKDTVVLVVTVPVAFIAWSDTDTVVAPGLIRVTPWNSLAPVPDPRMY